MKYVAKRQPDGGVDVTIRLSPSEVERLQDAGREAELFDVANPDEAFLGISFGKRSDYVVTEPDGGQAHIHAYGDLHAFTAATTVVDRSFAIERAA